MKGGKENGSKEVEVRVEKGGRCERSESGKGGRGGGGEVTQGHEKFAVASKSTTNEVALVVVLGRL
jgi:hypothetical protein